MRAAAGADTGALERLAPIVEAQGSHELYEGRECCHFGVSDVIRWESSDRDQSVQGAGRARRRLSRPAEAERVSGTERKEQQEHGCSRRDGVRHTRGPYTYVSACHGNHAAFASAPGGSAPPLRQTVAQLLGRIMLIPKEMRRFPPRLAAHGGVKSATATELILSELIKCSTSVSAKTQRGWCTHRHAIPLDTSSDVGASRGKSARASPDCR